MECAIGIFKRWGTMYPRVYCPGRGDSITTEGTLYLRVNCPGDLGYAVRGDNV